MDQHERDYAAAVARENAAGARLMSARDSKAATKQRSAAIRASGSDLYITNMFANLMDATARFLADSARRWDELADEILRLPIDAPCTEPTPVGRLPAKDGG